MIKFSIQSNCHFLAKLLSTVQSQGIHSLVFNTFEGKSGCVGYSMKTLNAVSLITLYITFLRLREN